MAKHGYTVEHGYFSGACGGHKYAPIQHERTRADLIVRQCHDDIVSMDRMSQNLQRGTTKPDEARSGPGMRDKLIPFAEASEYQQKQAVDSAVWQLERRSRDALAFANFLSNCASLFHGQPLMEVKRPAAPDPIRYGERRVSSKGDIYSVQRVEKARVYFRTDTGRVSWIGTRAWRALELAPDEAQK
jgi:hypothetical protein